MELSLNNYVVKHYVLLDVPGSVLRALVGTYDCTATDVADALEQFRAARGIRPGVDVVVVA